MANDGPALPVQVVVAHMHGKNDVQVLQHLRRQIGRRHDIEGNQQAGFRHLHVALLSVTEVELQDIAGFRSAHVVSLHVCQASPNRASLSLKKLSPPRVMPETRPGASASAVSAKKPASAVIRPRIVPPSVRAATAPRVRK